MSAAPLRGYSLTPTYLPFQYPYSRELPQNSTGKGNWTFKSAMDMYGRTL